MTLLQELSLRFSAQAKRICDLHQRCIDLWSVYGRLDASVVDDLKSAQQELASLMLSTSAEMKAFLNGHPAAVRYPFHLAMADRIAEVMTHFGDPAFQPPTKSLESWLLLISPLPAILASLKSAPAVRPSPEQKEP